MGKPMVWGSRYLYPICSIFRENVGKYSIHGAYMGILGNLHMQNKAAHNKRNATEFDSSWWETQFSSGIERHQQHQHASSSPRMGNAPMGNTFDSVPWNAVCYWTACQFVSLPFKPAWESVDMESASLTLKTKSLCVCRSLWEDLAGFLMRFIWVYLGKSQKIRPYMPCYLLNLLATYWLQLKM